jgi:hypothetical protein
MNIKGVVQHKFSHVKQKNRKSCDEQASMHPFMQDITDEVDEVLVANSSFLRAREGRDNRLWSASSDEGYPMVSCCQHTRRVSVKYLRILKTPLEASVHVASSPI